MTNSMKIYEVVLRRVRRVDSAVEFVLATSEDEARRVVEQLLEERPAFAAGLHWNENRERPATDCEPEIAMVRAADDVPFRFVRKALDELLDRHDNRAWMEERARQILAERQASDSRRG